MRATHAIARPLALSAALLAPWPAATLHADARGGPPADYQIWASDQSNSVPGETAAGVRGSYLWIWDGRDIERQLAGGREARPLGCVPPGPGERGRSGPCDLLDVFPRDLVEVDAAGAPTGTTLGDVAGFGRLHGMIADPQGRYVTANVFAPGGGFVGVVDTRRRAPVALFRASGTSAGGGTDARSVHMSFWDATGSAILVANLDGKILERIDVERDRQGRITGLVFARMIVRTITASLG